MMTDKEYNTQTLVERDALYPTEPATDDIIIRGEDAHEELAPVETVEKTYDDFVRESLKSEIDNFEAWAAFKVKNMLVVQLVRNESPDIEKTVALLKGVVEEEKDRQFQASTHLQMTEIPLASKRTTFNPDKPNDYWQKDLPNLELRVDVHDQFVEVLDTIEQSGESGFETLSEVFINRTLAQAQAEAISALIEQKKTLEKRVKEDDSRITELKDAIATLSDELQDRDIELYERELEGATKDNQQLVA